MTACRKIHSHLGRRRCARGPQPNLSTENQLLQSGVVHVPEDAESHYDTNAFIAGCTELHEVAKLSASMSVPELTISWLDPLVIIARTITVAVASQEPIMTLNTTAIS